MDGQNHPGHVPGAAPVPADNRCRPNRLQHQPFPRDPETLHQPSLAVSRQDLVRILYCPRADSPWSGLLCHGVPLERCGQGFQFLLLFGLPDRLVVLFTYCHMGGGSLLADC